MKKYKVFNYVTFIQIIFLDLKIMKGILCWYPVSIFSLANLNLSRNEIYLETQAYKAYISVQFRIS